MFLEPKIKNFLRIRVKEKVTAIVPNDINEELYPFSIDKDFENEKYGFSLIIDTNNDQKEIIYPTQYNIETISSENDIIKIFEQNKENDWIFDRKGNLIYSPLKEFIDITNLEEDDLIAIPMPYIIEKPITIQIDKKTNTIRVIIDGKCYNPLVSNIIVDSGHYGFSIIVDTKQGQKEFVFPTQDKINNISISSDNFKIYENEKCEPWIFDFNGKVIQKSLNKNYRVKSINNIDTVDTYHHNVLVKKRTNQ